jgi:hypothetical protein
MCYINGYRTLTILEEVYVGPSNQHTCNIPLIFNPATVHVTLQFHVVYNEGFTSLLPLPIPEQNQIIKSSNHTMTTKKATLMP